MDKIDSLALRKAVGRFGTGVCVVTTMANDNAAAMTVNSFTSVSLEPALVLWNIRNESGLFNAFVNGESFNINILARHQRELSNRCAGKSNNPLNEDDYFLGSNGQPVIAGALATLECRLWSTKPAGDHEIVIGEVTTLHNSETQNPLLFYCGQYLEYSTTAAPRFVMPANSAEAGWYF